MNKRKSTVEKTSEALESLVGKGDLGGVAAFFEDMPEAQRRTFGPGIVALVRGFRETYWISDPGSGNTADASVRTAASLAVMASANLSELKKLGWRCSPPVWNDDEQALYLAILRNRGPDWIDAWADWLLEQNFRHWRFVRRMVLDSMCAAPKSDVYVLGMIEGIRPRHDDDTTLADAILADRELLDNLFWRLFEIEGGGDLSLAACDKFAAGEHSWAHAMRDLAARGAIDRDRLLDASLDALGRDYLQFRAGWFSRFHEFLEPTLEERAIRAHRYLDLLASPIPPTVSFAMKALSVLHKAKKLDGAAYVERVEPVFFAKAKGTVKQALRLLTDFAKSDSSLAGAAARIAATGLEHPDSEVQETAHSFVATFGDIRDSNLRTAVQEKMDVIAAPLKPRVLDWLGADAAPAADDTMRPDNGLSNLVARAKSLPPDLSDVAGVNFVLTAMETPDGLVPPLRFNGLDIPRLSDEEKIEPTESLDALIGLFLRALETPDDIELHEQVLDGVMLLCDQRPADFETLTAPLAKRVAKLRNNTPSGLHDATEPEMLLAGLADAWLSGQPTEIGEDRNGEPVVRMNTPEFGRGESVASYGIGGIFLLRAADATRLIAARTTGRLLSAPTHAGGWISPMALVERTRERQTARAAASLADQVLALLRLAPDGRDGALRSAGTLDGEWASALRYALGGDETIGDTAALWVAAARSRAPFADDPAVEARFPKLGPDAGQAATLDYFITSRTEKPYTWHFFNIACDPPPAKKIPLHRHKKAGPATGGGGAPALMPTVMAHRNTGDFMSYYESARARRDALSTGYEESPWGPMLWPLNPDVLFANTARNTAFYLDDPRAASSPPYAGYAVAMNPNTPLTRMAYVMLALGLNARDAAEGQIATDLLIAATDDGRLDAQSLGAELCELLFSGMCKPKRWADRLGEAARASPLQAATVRLATELALQGEPGVSPRDVHALMELLHALCVELGEATTLPETRDYLASLSGGGKAAKLAKTLLAQHETTPLQHRRAAAARALAGRIDRVERWMRQKSDRP